jgi:hypothetical protein
MHIGSEDKTIAIATRRLQFVWMVKKPGMYLARSMRRLAH